MRVDFGSNDQWLEVRRFIRNISLSIYPFILGYQGDSFAIMSDDAFIGAMLSDESFEHVERITHPLELMMRMYPWWHEGEEYPV